MSHLYNTQILKGASFHVHRMCTETRCVVHTARPCEIRPFRFGGGHNPLGVDKRRGTHSGGRGDSLVGSGKVSSALLHSPDTMLLTQGSLSSSSISKPTF